MADWGVGSSLRRWGASTGAVLALGLVLAVSALAAAPTPDPPPLPAPPKQTEPVQPTVTVVVREAPPPVVQRAVPPVAKAPPPRAKPKPAPAKVKRVVRPKPATPALVVWTPHDRHRVPLAAFVPAAADPVDRDLLALAGFGLLLVALGGAVVLFAARRQLALAALGLLALVGPVTNAAAAPVSSTVVGTPGANGWHTSNVTVKWTVVDDGQLLGVDGCSPADLITAEGTATSRCTAHFAWGDVVGTPVTVKIDKTAPTGVGASLARDPDSDGWFNHPVAAAFGGQDAVSGIASCTSPTYSGGDSASASLSGTCTDVAGNTSGASVGFKYDATPPAVTPSADRPPDGKGWYRKPVTVSFAGTDLTSGIASCTAPARYAGPDLATASVLGSCRDAAGNVAEAGHSFQYDATAPALPRVKAEVEKGVAKIVWQRSPDAVLVELERTPGINGRKKTIVYRGNGVSFTDKTVRDGVRYRYEIRAADLAGNLAQKVVTANVDRPTLFRPEEGAAVRGPLVLAWEVEQGASYYNVQLHRNGVKVLSAWPKTATLRVGQTWRYAGKVRRLEPGRYRWYVWGARGTRAKPRYGKLLGSSSFVVR